MQILLNDQNGKTRILKSSNVKVSELYKRVDREYNIEKSNFSLVFGSKMLNMNENIDISNLGIRNGSMINMSVKCLGGVLTETDRACLTNRIKKNICRSCYARNSVRATNCRKKDQCGGCSNLRPKRTKKSTKKTS